MIRFPDHIPTRYLLGAAGLLLIIIPYSMWLPRYTTSDPSYCLKCHGEDGGLPNRGIASTIHPGYDKVSCVDCHAKPGHVVYEGYVQGFAAEIERVSPNCMSCHQDILTKNDIEGFKYNVDKIGIPHKLHLDMGASCTDCHANIVHDLHEKPTFRPRMEFCSQCHATTIEPCAKCHIEKIPSGPIPLAPPAGVVGDGKTLYDRNCASCHGSKGNGVAKVNLLSKELFETYDVVTLREVTLKGHRMMPTFSADKGGFLTTDEVRAIIAHLKLSTAGIQPSGQALYDNYCAVCHGTTGDKMPTVNLSQPKIAQRLKTDGIIKVIRVGKKGMMAFDKPHGGPLAFESIASIAKYVKSLSEPKVPVTAEIDGAPLYQEHCASCHGAKGKDVETANLASGDHLKRIGDDRFIKTTANGTDVMPGFGKKAGGELSDDQINAILNHLKSKAGIVVEDKTAMGKAPAIPHEVSEDMEDCLECHGSDGMKPVPANHLGRTVKTCRTCHKAQ